MPLHIPNTTPEESRFHFEVKLVKTGSNSTKSRRKKGRSVFDGNSELTAEREIGRYDSVTEATSSLHCSHTTASENLCQLGHYRTPPSHGNQIAMCMDDKWHYALCHGVVTDGNFEEDDARNVIATCPDHKAAMEGYDQSSTTL